MAEEFYKYPYDKFVFTVKRGYHYTEYDSWVEIKGEEVKIGITDYLQRSIGDVTFVNVPEAGKVVEQFDEMGEIESIKTVITIHSPIAGKIVEINSKLESEPYILNEEPFGKGWIARIKPTHLEDDIKNLLTDEKYLELMKKKIREYKGTGKGE